MSGDSLFSTLITANHILHHHDVVDAYGHISVRNPLNPDTFFISASTAPALVSSPADLVEYNVFDASAVQDDPPRGYAERFIHSEIYKKYPEVNSVVHAHAEAVIPFSILRTDVNDSVPKLKPVYHMAGIMGPEVPIFDIASHYQTGDRQDMLVNNRRLGAALAAEMMPSGLLSGLSKTVMSYLGSPPSVPTFPACPVILMRKHGFTCVGRSIEEAVYRSIYTQSNARILTNTLVLQATINQKRLSPWKSEHDKSSQTALEPMYLTGPECRDSWTANLGHADRPWKLWCREVTINPLYRNTLSPPPGV